MPNLKMYESTIYAFIEKEIKKRQNRTNLIRSIHASQLVLYGVPMLPSSPYYLLHSSSTYKQNKACMHACNYI